jgi:TfoX/Sxy family transcriptional regulator of competence genes
MFGEYAVYVDDKVVGFVCDDRLLLKITPANEKMVRTQVTGKPYPGAKDYSVFGQARQHDLIGCGQ